MRVALRGWAVGIPLAVIAASCGGAESHPGELGGGGGPDASLFGSDGGLVGHAGQACHTDTDCGPGGLCDPGMHTCGCGGTQVMAHNVAPNLLIVMDRSCSMQQLVSGTTKWTVAVHALTNLTQTYGNRIQFGLELFPERGAADKCMVDTIPVPLGPGTATAIGQLLSASLAKSDPNYPSGPCVTPIDTAMAAAATDPDLADPIRADFALLITDGEQAGCNVTGADTRIANTITAMHARSVGTFVVGFGAAVSVKALDGFAQAGGEVNAAGPNAFYNASDEVSLDSALTAIAQSTLSCTLQLGATPPNGDASLIYVYLDKKAPAVARDATHTSGWDYDPKSNTVTFYGAPCNALKTGQATDAEVVFGCVGGSAPPGPTM